MSRLDRGELSADGLSADLAEVLGLCEEYRIATGGAFDVRLPGRGLDPCAVVKGWSVQRAADLLTARRTRPGSASTPAVTWSSSGGPWRVGVRHPYVADKVCAVLGLTDAAVATSARYERGDHILDGRTGLPGAGLDSVTVVAPDPDPGRHRRHRSVRARPRGRGVGGRPGGLRGLRRGRRGRRARTPGFPTAGAARRPDVPKALRQRLPTSPDVPSTCRTTPRTRGNAEKRRGQHKRG